VSRQANDNALHPHDTLPHSAQSQVEAVKMFLGVLGNDVLREDLSAIDPRRVAQGEREEIMYVGKLLLLVAKRVGLLGVDEIVDLDPNQSFSKINQDASLLSEISSLQLQPEDTSIFSSPLAPNHPLYSPLPTPKQANSHYAPTELLRPPSTPILRSSRPNGLHIPERQSTPPLEMKKPNARISPQSLRNRPEAPSVNTSVCTCTLDLDETRTTMHCHCDVHDSHVGSGYFYESTVVQRARYEAPRSHGRRALERYHA
jgi:hypothetical protein